MWISVSETLRQQAMMSRKCVGLKYGLTMCNHHHRRDGQTQRVPFTKMTGKCPCPQSTDCFKALKPLCSGSQKPLRRQRTWNYLSQQLFALLAYQMRHFRSRRPALPLRVRLLSKVFHFPDLGRILLLTIPSDRQTFKTPVGWRGRSRL